MKNSLKPDWIVYKNDIAICNGITWHKALDNLIKHEGFMTIELGIYSKVVYISNKDNMHRYKIVKER